VTDEVAALHDDLVLMMNERNKASALLKESEDELVAARALLDRVVRAEARHAIGDDLADAIAEYLQPVCKHTTVIDTMPATCAKCGAEVDE